MAQQGEVGEPARSLGARLWANYRFRAFLILSVAAHAALGLSWGVPSYVHHRREEAAARAAEKKHLAELASIQAAVEKAKVRSFEQSRRDVELETRRTFETLVGDLPLKQKERVWDAVRPPLSPDIDAMAKTLADSSATEQDLRNIQAGLNRKLVEAVNVQLHANAGRNVADEFLDRIEHNVVPALADHVRGRLGERVGVPLRAEAGTFLDSGRATAEQAGNEAKATINAAGGKLGLINNELSAAAADANRAQQSAKPEDARAAIASATQHLQAAKQLAGDGAADLARGATSAAGAAASPDIAPAIQEAVTQWAALSMQIDKATAGLAAQNAADANATLAGLGLAGARLTASVRVAGDACDGAGEAMIDIRRGAIAIGRNDVWNASVQQQFGKAFRDTASTRLAGVLANQLTDALKSRNISDPKLVEETRPQIKQLLEEKLLATPDLGGTVAERIRDVAVPAADAALTRARDQFAKVDEPAEKIIARGATEAANDDSADRVFADRSRLTARDGTDEDVRFRLETMAKSAAEGRTVSNLDAASSTDLSRIREGALARGDEIDAMAAGERGPDVEATTQPDNSELVDSVKTDIWDMLAKDLAKILEGKLSKEKEEQLLKDLRKNGDGDVEKLARALLDANTSDRDLGSQRQKLSIRFYDLLRAALDHGTAGDMSSELVKKIQGDLGDKILARYKDQLKANVGDPLARGLAAGKEDARRAQSRNAGGLRQAMDDVRNVAGKANELLDAVNNHLAQANTDAHSEGGRLDQISKAFNDAKGELDAVAHSGSSHGPQIDAKVNDAAGAAGGLGQKLAAAAAAAKAGNGEGAKKAIADAKGEIGRVVASLDAARSGLDQQAGQAGSEFARAVKDADGTADGLGAQITQDFNEKFRKEALGKLSQSVVGAYRRRLEEAGVKSDVPQGELEKQVATELDKKITGGTARTGDSAMAAVKDSGITNDADKATTQPSGKVVADVKAIAGKAVAAGIDAALDTTSSRNEAEGAVNGVPGESDATHQIKLHLNDLETQALVGAGGVLAGDAKATGTTPPTTDPAGEPGAGDPGAGAGALAALRKKYLGGGDGTGDGNGDEANAGGQPGGQFARGHGPADGDTQTGAGEGTGAGAAGNGAAGATGGTAGGTAGAGNGTGAGTGAGNGTAAPGAGALANGGAAGAGAGGAGHGRGPALGRVAGAHPRQNKFDSETYQKIKTELANRDAAAAKGQDWERTGAQGDAARAVLDSTATHPARIVSPASLGTAVVKNGEPYAPTFKSIRFLAIPHLNQRFVMDGNFDKWKDIPETTMKLERYDGQHQENLHLVDAIKAKVAWDAAGLYFIMDVVDADGVLTKVNPDKFPYSDVAEVWVDMLNTKESERSRGTGQQFWIWPFGSLSDENCPGGESLKDRNSGYHFAAFTPGQVLRGARKTQQGWQIEFCIPVERLRGGELVPGKIVGMNMTVETGGKPHYYWASSKAVDTFGRPDTWGDLLLAGSDAKLEIPEKLTGEFGAGDASKVVAAFVPGQPLRIRVTDRDMNLSPTARDKVSVTVRTPAGDTQTAILEETNVDTGVFEGSLRTALSLGERLTGTLSVYEGDTVSITYIDQARANGARNAQVTVRVKAGTALGKAAVFSAVH